jgi:hypothetical protein
MRPTLTSASAFAGLPPASASLLIGEFRYYHYGCDAFDDRGWGCGFRTVQCILSWLHAEPPPSIPALQTIIGHDSGGRSWIGVQEAVVLLDELHGALVRVLHLKSGGEAVAHLPTISAHFASGGGPIMVGGGADVYSKTVVGVRDEPPAFLVLDPHYYGSASADVDALRAAGWAAWMPLRTLLSEGSFYNIALPTRGSGCSAPRASPLSASDRAPADTQWDFEVVESGFANE